MPIFSPLPPAGHLAEGVPEELLLAAGGQLVPRRHLLPGPGLHPGPGLTPSHLLKPFSSPSPGNVYEDEGLAEDEGDLGLGHPRLLGKPVPLGGGGLQGPGEVGAGCWLLLQCTGYRLPQLLDI